MKIIFDIHDEVKRIEKEGISATEKSDMFKLTLLVQYYLLMQNLSKEECFAKVKSVAKGYFSLMPASEADKILQGIAEKAPCGIIKSTLLNPDLSVNIYQSEWAKLMELSDPAELLLAFTALVTVKFVGRTTIDGEVRYYKYVSAKESEIFSCADLSKKVMKGKTSESLWQSLFTKGFIDFRADFNYQYPRMVIGVPYNVDCIREKDPDDAVVFKVSHFDCFQNYIDFYKNRRKFENRDMKECLDCGKPFHAGKKRYCPTCAEARKRAA